MSDKMQPRNFLDDVRALFSRPDANYKWPPGSMGDLLGLGKHETDTEQSPDAPASSAQNTAATEFSPAQLAAIKKSANTWPMDKTVRRAGEELLELALSLIHYHDRGKATADEVKEEMADVHISLRHLEYVFGNYQAQLDKKVTKGNGPIQ